MRTSHIRIVAEIARGIFKTVPNARYLELGVWKARCFNVVASYFKDAIAVDINEKVKQWINVKHQFYCMTTEEYFANHYDGKLLNLTFIDACHVFANVAFDFENCYRATEQNGLILLHDTYPCDTRRFRGCRDAYKVCDWIKSNSNFKGELVTLPFFDGITIFRKCEKQLLWL
jgi:hypothetical protein